MFLLGRRFVAAAAVATLVVPMVIPVARAGVVSATTITIVKVTDPASDPQAFDFDLTGAGIPADLDLDTDAGDGSLPSQQLFDLSAEVPATFTVTESLTSGWILVDLQCTGAGPDSSVSLWNRAATVNLDAGEAVVCTFTNAPGDAAFTIRKQTSPEEDGRDFDFDFEADGPEGPLAPFELDTDPTNDIPDHLTTIVTGTEVGEWTVTELDETDWSLFGVSCDGDTEAVLDAENSKVSVSLDTGEHAVCIFYNYFDRGPSGPPSTDPVNTDGPVDTDAPEDTDGPGGSDGPTFSDEPGGESDAPTQPGGTDTAAQQPAGTAGNNVVLLVIALGVLVGILLVTRPKRKGP